MESITLRLWRVPNKYSRDADNYRVRGSVAGFFTVYCGAGNGHTVEINEELDAWMSDVGRDSIVGHVADLWLSNDNDAAWQLASEVVYELALDDWFDPCDTEMDEEGDRD
jgi:hypothetical protein